MWTIFKGKETIFEAQANNNTDHKTIMAIGILTIKEIVVETTIKEIGVTTTITTTKIKKIGVETIKETGKATIKVGGATIRATGGRIF